MAEKFVRWFENLTSEDVPTVGGKNASLGEMISNLDDKSEYFISHLARRISKIAAEVEKG